MKKIVNHAKRNLNAYIPLGLAAAEILTFQGRPDWWDRYGDWTRYGSPVHAADVAHIFLGAGGSEAGRNIYDWLSHDTERGRILSSMAGTASVAVLKEGLDVVRNGSLKAIGIDDLAFDLLGGAISIGIYKIRNMKK